MSHLNGDSHSQSSLVEQEYYDIISFKNDFLRKKESVLKLDLTKLTCTITDDISSLNDIIDTCTTEWKQYFKYSTLRDAHRTTLASLTIIEEIALEMKKIINLVPNNEKNIAYKIASLTSMTNRLSALDASNVSPLNQIIQELSTQKDRLIDDLNTVVISECNKILDELKWPLDDFLEKSSSIKILIQFLLDNHTDIVKIFAQPIENRFYFHFCRDNPTNRVEMPEWCLDDMKSIVLPRIHALSALFPFITSDLKHQMCRKCYDLLAEKFNSELTFLLDNEEYGIACKIFRKIINFDRETEHETAVSLLTLLKFKSHQSPLQFWISIEFSELTSTPMTDPAMYEEKLNELLGFLVASEKIANLSALITLLVSYLREQRSFIGSINNTKHTSEEIIVKEIFEHFESVILRLDASIRLLALFTFDPILLHQENHFVIDQIEDFIGEDLKSIHFENFTTKYFDEFLQADLNKTLFGSRYSIRQVYESTVVFYANLNKLLISQAEIAGIFQTFTSKIDVYLLNNFLLNRNWDDKFLDLLQTIYLCFFHIFHTNDHFPYLATFYSLLLTPAFANKIPNNPSQCTVQFITDIVHQINPTLSLSADQILSIKKSINSSQ